MRPLIERLLDAERSRYQDSHPASSSAHTRARTRLPYGVGSSFQYFEPYPITIDRAQGPYAWDVDGNKYLDLNMGFGALLTGHLNPVVLDAVSEQMSKGTLFVAPSEAAFEVADALQERFSHPLWRFTNSGTEAVMTAVRAARAYTGRDKLVKVIGGYHGHSDTTLVSCKPSLDSSDAVSDTRGLLPGVLENTIAIPYNDADALEHVLIENAGKVAAFLVEPVLENVGIILPRDGYLSKVREICTKHGVLLIFDEVKTGLTSSYFGAQGLYGVRADITCLAKSIGGGFPIGALGGEEDVMRVFEKGCVHHGTYNSNPLVLAATKATLSVCSKEALEETYARNKEFTGTVRTMLEKIRVQAPTFVAQVGCKGSVTFSSTQPARYEDWKNSDMVLAELSWLWSTNRGVLTPPGLDEQWLVSLAHDEESLSIYLEQLQDLVTVLS
jgi:glutamate-1-semialdehyde 2,1-aminomutase